MKSRPLMFGYVREEQIPGSLDEVELQLRTFAVSEGYCLSAVYHDAGALTGALWVLVHELERMEYRRLVVPSRAHLAPVTAPRAALLRKLAALSPSVHAWSLLPREGVSVLTRSTPPEALSASAVTLGSFRLRVSESAWSTARLHVHERLTRAGLRELVEACEAVVGAVLAEAAEFARAVQVGVHPIYAQIEASLNELEVRLLVWPAMLEVQVVETRSHASDLVPTVLGRYGEPGRKSALGGGTLTWCAIPLPGGWGEMVRTTHAYRAALDVPG
ncbi:hypothetical protein K7711_02835 [Nocardia sp. CA2R105]|uniref:hypothetical protein n=1 Tax=Nocardia coffeae TaxID=2873381 RepID=UPI001CA69CF1|nr:hypothetical protein [Nocardia coffeae]MBY8855403.1 hypothetical protein [Nocardia coffeae]